MRGGGHPLLVSAASVLLFCCCPSLWLAVLVVVRGGIWGGIRKTYTRGNYALAALPLQGLIDRSTTSS